MIRLINNSSLYEKMRMLARNNKKKISHSHKRKKTNRMKGKISSTGRGKNQKKQGRRLGLQFATQKRQRRHFKRIGKQADHQPETRWSVEKTKNDFLTAVNITSFPSKDDFYKLNKIDFSVDIGLLTCIKSTMSGTDDSEKSK